MKQAIAEIVANVGEDSVSIEDEILFSHGFSEWSNYNSDRLPVAVVFPSTTEEVSQIVKVSIKYKIPLSTYFWWKLLVASRKG